MNLKNVKAYVKCELRSCGMEHEWHYRTRSYDGVVQDCHITHPVPRDGEYHPGSIIVHLLGDGRAHLCETMESVIIRVEDDEIQRIEQMVMLPFAPLRDLGVTNTDNKKPCNTGETENGKSHQLFEVHRP